MDCKIIKYILLIFLINFKVFSAEFQGKFIQGHYIIGKTSPGTKILIDKKRVKVSKKGYFAFGINRSKSDLIKTIHTINFKEEDKFNYFNIQTT